MLSSTSPRRGSRVVSLLTIALVVASAAHGEGTTQVSPVPGVVANATAVGKPAQTDLLHLSFGLPPTSRTAMHAYANRLSNPSDAIYHHFLTPAQIGDKFGPSQSTLNIVTTYLKGKGFTIRTVNGSRLSFLADATVKQAESAFNTKFVNYQLKTADARYRTNFYANSTPVKLPTSVATKLAIIGGLNNAIQPKPAIIDINQTRTLYNIAPFFSSGSHGEGSTIGIINAGDGYRLSNVPLLYSQYGLPAPSGGVGKNIHKAPVSGVDGETQDAGGESDLDIQMVLGMAPLCNLYIYDGFTSGPFDFYTKVASDNVCDVVTESWEYGLSAPDDDAYATSCNDVRTQMSMQGISSLSAAGDYGAIGRPNSGNTAGHQDPYPHFDPEVLQVGGTIASVSSTGSRTAEVAWSVGSTAIGEGGGGGGWEPAAFSINQRAPYQSAGSPYFFNVRPDVNKRLYPDVSFNAAGNNSGAYYFFLNGSITGDYSGTSFASPMFAGLLAVTEQKLFTDGFFESSSRRLGRLQDIIYAQQGAPSIYFDIVSGTIGPLPDGTSADATPGWDFATGWGAMDMGAFESTLLATSSVLVIDSATSASVPSITSPSLVLGTVVGGDVTSLPNTDGVSYIIQSVKQNGLGQVAAARVAVPLQTAKTRSSASVTLSMSIPAKATGYLYLLRAGLDAAVLSNYDLVQTIPGTGSMGTNTVQLDVDNETYITGSSAKKGGTVTALVRAIIPTRLGSAPFNLTVDQLSVNERVQRG